MKEHLMEAKKLEGAKKRQRNRAVADATKVLAKVCSPIADLSAKLSDPGVKNVPRHIVKEARDSRKILEAYKEEAEKCITDPCVSTLTFELTQITAATLTAKTSMGNLECVLVAIKKCGGA